MSDELPSYAAPVEGRGFDSWLVRAGKTSNDFETTFTASTADVDRMGDIVEQDWRLRDYRRNPVILNNHNPREVVGMSLDSRVPKDTGNLTIKVKWDVSDFNPMGQLIGHQHKNGFRNAGSVGFTPGKRTRRSKLPTDDPRYIDPEKFAGYSWEIGSVFSKNVLLEFSSASIPANAAALQLSLHANEGETEQERIARMINESVDRKLAAALLDIAKNNPEFRRAIIALTLAEPVIEQEPASDLDGLFGPQEPDNITHLFQGA